MSERDLQDWIVAAARLLGWRAFHSRPCRTKDGWRTAGSYDSQGLPDLLLVRDRIVFAEIKVGRNKLSPEQVVWLEALGQAGVEVHVWTDKDWMDGVVEDVLRREAAA